MRLAWAAETQVFSMQDHQLQTQLSGRPPAGAEIKPRARCKAAFLNKNPVQVLMIDDGDRIDSVTPVEQ